MNIFQKAKENIISDEIKFIAEQEDLSLDFVMKHFTSGETVILKNSLRNINPVAIGKGVSTKINANIGSSPDMFVLDDEMEKLRIAVEFGADAVMDLSIGGDVTYFRRKILEKSPVPLGTVPIYEVIKELTGRKKSIMEMTIDDFLMIVERQAKEGVDFMTIHSGITKSSLESLYSQKRLVGITSRGGSILAEWIKKNNKENPLFEYYNDILDIMAEYNCVISLGDGLRPGGVHDANDRGQIHEMVELGNLARRAREKGVQVIIEGPGHMPINLIEANMKLQKSLCDGAPYYVLGPLVTDIAPGYDHITGAIGGAIAASNGADFLCYVTPAEHLRLPSADDVKEGVIASKIAAHAADIVKLGEKALKKDNQMSEARKRRDWETMYKLALDPQKAKKYRSEIPSNVDDQCSMCGDFCAMKRDY